MSLRILFFLLFSINGFYTYSQCEECTVTIDGNNAPSGTIFNGSKICIIGNRTNAINFNNRNNISICIADGASWNGQANSLSALNQIDNYGTISVSNDYNGDWTLNNYGTLNFSTNINSSRSVNNFNTMNVPGSIIVNFNLFSEGELNIVGSATFNSGSNVSIIGEMNVAGSLANNSTINLAGTISVGGAMTNNGNGRIEALDANQCNSVSVVGSFGSDGVITGNNLDFNNTGTALVVNKMPGGNANPKLEGGASVGTCSSSDCLEIVEVIDLGNLLRYYIFRCDGILNVDSPVIEDEYEEEILSVTALIVAGGGGGGLGLSAGGGGAGGIIEIEDLPVSAGINYPVKVGKGGVGSSSASLQGRNGNNSSLVGNSALGGGGGGSSSEKSKVGRQGGSGGGGAYDDEGNGGNVNGPANQVSRGGGNAGRRGNSNVRAGGGGGGAGTAGGMGQTSTGFVPGNGGNGISIEFADPISPTTLINAFGGGGGATARNSGGQTRKSEGGKLVDYILGGSGNDSGNGANGIQFTGSGGGAGSARGGSGSNGIVIVLVTYRILPVDFLYFNGELNENESKSKIILNWATAKEWESSHFEVMRSYDNVSTWQKIGEVKAAGFSDQIENYQFEDKDNFNFYKMAYYQLKQVDIDLSFHQSKIIGVQLPSSLEKNSTWAVYPNPTERQSANLILKDRDNFEGGSIMATLVNPLGNTQSFYAETVKELSELFNQTLQQSAKGMYVLHLVWGKNEQQIKILKK
ncbi:glycine-rich domain-containing protein [Mongoliibacter ruber]|uniref:Putative secreted protein (Por secretion system target) n=1 Tax=Mongoliibacter ruber TaxID=1750599 RepID=A0A2T0WH47_9BACT|nr:hypothetical protein [Mongoliibacter ruber]PRY86023.1 putative secreted protein (Por secretion system target) [Mongoliibacter ruber]